MVQREKCSPPREGCTPGEDGKLLSCNSSRVLRHRRHTARGCVPRPSRCQHTQVVRGCYVGDYVPGCGCVSTTIRHLGFTAREYETLHGPTSDLTRPSVLRQIAQDMKACTLISAMFAPPCSTFSVARNRGGPIRSIPHPWAFLVSQLVTRTGQNSTMVTGA